MEIKEQYFSVDWYWASLCGPFSSRASWLSISFTQGKAQFAKRSRQVLRADCNIGISHQGGQIQFETWTDTYLHFGQIQFAGRSQQVLNWSGQTAASAFPLNLASHCNLALSCTELTLHRTVQVHSLCSFDPVVLNCAEFDCTVDRYQLQWGILCCLPLHCSTAFIRLASLSCKSLAAAIKVFLSRSLFEAKWCAL